MEKEMGKKEDEPPDLLLTGRKTYIKICFKKYFHVEYILTCNLLKVNSKLTDFSIGKLGQIDWKLTWCKLYYNKANMASYGIPSPIHTYVPHPPSVHLDGQWRQARGVFVLLILLISTEFKLNFQNFRYTRIGDIHPSKNLLKTYRSFHLKINLDYVAVWTD